MKRSMKQALKIRTMIAAVGLISLVAFQGNAQSVRTFVSTSGTDNAICSRTAPCRTFTAAIAAVNPAGEVMPLDSGGYLPFIITKEVAIVVPPGVHAAVAPTAGTAITIQAASTDTISLRGLFINRQGSAVNGIDFVSGAMLYVQNCEVAGFDSGLRVVRSMNNERTDLSVTDSTFRECHRGVYLRQTGTLSVLHAVLNRCNLENNGLGGLVVQDQVWVTAHEVTSSGSDTGFSFSVMSGYADAALDHCVATGNTTAGVFVTGDARVRLNECTITHNYQGVRFSGSGGVVYTLETNMIEGNEFNVPIGSLTPIAPK